MGAGSPKLTFGLASGLQQMQGGLCHANAIGLGPVPTNQNSPKALSPSLRTIGIHRHDDIKLEKLSRSTPQPRVNSKSTKVMQKGIAFSDVTAALLVHAS